MTTKELYMFSFIVRRLLLIMPVLLLLSIAFFCTTRLALENPADLIPDHLQADMGDHGVALSHGVGFEVPLNIQYMRWAGNKILQDSIGQSLILIGNTFTHEEIAHRFSQFLGFGFLAIIVPQLIILLIGARSAIFRDSL